MPSARLSGEVFSTYSTRRWSGGKPRTPTPRASLEEPVGASGWAEPGSASVCQLEGRALKVGHEALFIWLLFVGSFSSPCHLYCITHNLIECFFVFFSRNMTESGSPFYFCGINVSVWNLGCEKKNKTTSNKQTNKQKLPDPPPMKNSGPGLPSAQLCEPFQYYEVIYIHLTVFRKKTQKLNFGR